MLKKMLGSILIVFVSIIILQQKNINAPAAIRIDREVYAVGGDTTYQLQQLLDYNKYGYYNLTVRIPAGKYNLTKELRIYSNTTIIADKDAVLMKNHQKGAMIANDLTNDKGGYSTSENIQIIGGVWDSKNIALGDQGTESLRFIHATNVTVKDATICNVPDGSHLITFAGVKNGTIDNCHLYGYYGTTEKEAIHLDIVHDSIMVPSMQKASLLYDDTACDGITIKNSEITNYPRAIGAHTSVKGVYHKNIIISDNYIHDVQEAAVKAYNFVNLTIDHNRMEHVGLGILVYTYL